MLQSVLYLNISHRICKTLFISLKNKILNNLGIKVFVYIRIIFNFQSFEILKQENLSKES